MNTRKLLALAVLLILGLAFYFGMDAYRDRTQAEQDTRIAVEGSRLVRMHTPIIGPQNAPVTIVEFFDPACETCRAFYPLAQDIEDLTALQVSKTPTFFVNGRSLPSFGPEQLTRLVAEEVGKLQR